MHTLIPYAAAPGARCQQALPSLRLPHLTQLLQILTPGACLQGSLEDLTPVHERAWAHVLGMDGADGLIGWAALDAQRLGPAAAQGPNGWAWITPCHWTAQHDHIDMADPLQLGITPAEVDTLLQAMHSFFSQDGITLFDQPTGHARMRFLVHGKVFKDLPTASLDRVSGRAVDHWIPRQPQAQALLRLQNEVQMLLYTHPLNAARASSQQPSVNSFWISGTGTLTPAQAQRTLQVTPAQARNLRGALRTSALQDDAHAWLNAWEQLDSTLIAELLQQARAGQPLQLTLCGELQAVTLENQPRSLWSRLQRRWQPRALHDFLRTL